jgi:hypothetical protein
MDGMQYINHGEGSAANVGLNYWPKLWDDHLIAIRDIEAGEELHEDYRSCLCAGMTPNHWLRPLYLEFAPGHFEFLLDVFGLPSPVYPGTSAVVANEEKHSIVEMSEFRNTGLGRTAAKPAARQAA